MGDEELPKTSERFFNEWKSLQKEKDKLLKELANRMLFELKTNAKIINNMKYAIKVFDDMKNDDMITLGNEIITRDPNFIVEFIAKNSRLNVILMAGKSPIDKGLHCGNLLREMVGEFGGGGGGRRELGQGGGIIIQDLEKFKQHSVKFISEQLNNL